jgi:hypothetical protein
MSPWIIKEGSKAAAEHRRLNHKRSDGAKKIQNAAAKKIGVDPSHAKARLESEKKKR